MIELIEENVWNDHTLTYLKKKNIVNISILYYNYNYYNIIIVYFHFIEDKEYSKWHVQDIRTSHKDLALRKRSRREKSIREYL